MQLPMEEPSWRCVDFNENVIAVNEEAGGGRVTYELVVLELLS